MDRLEILEESRGRRYIGTRPTGDQGGTSVKRRRLGQRQGERNSDWDLDGALEAMTAPELRAFVHAVLDELENEQRAGILDALMARAARGDAGWKPNRPSPRIVDNVRLFADAARRVGYADPDDVSEHLRQGTKAFLAGDHASARAVFESLLPPIAAADIDLGQHELVEEVLGIDAHACVAQYVTSVYTTTPLAKRADAVQNAIEQIEGVGTLLNPIAEMEDVSAGALPDLTAFLPLWVKRLGRRRPSKDEWETNHERWLREAVFRLEGVGGLERIARRTKRPRACLAWCEALVDRGDGAGALRAYEASAALAGKSLWRGELFDGAALAAQQLGRSDVSRRLEAAWRAAPTLIRLLRWLAADGRAPTVLRTRTKKALARCPKTAGRQLGLLRVLRGDLRAAADLLSKAPGLGWSGEDHPGHVLFPAFVVLLANGTPSKVSDTIIADLESTCRDPLDALSADHLESRPTLATPSIVALIRDVRSSLGMGGADRDAMLAALRLATEKRVEGILGHSRRRHYGHAAMLAASCVALAPMNRREDASAWIADLRQTYKRRHAFREELRRALESLGVSA